MWSKLPKPNLVVFDLDNTLYEYKNSHNMALRSVSQFAKAEYGIPPHIFLESYEKSRARVKSRVSGASSHNRLLYFTELITELNLKLDTTTRLYDEYWSAYFQVMKLAEGTEEFMQKLRHSGVQICIVTDQISHTQVKKLKILGIEKYLDYMVTSEECSGKRVR